VNDGRAVPSMPKVQLKGEKMTNKTIQLKKPIELAGGEIVKEVQIKEPIGALYIEHGDPRMLVKNADQALYWVEDRAAIKGYLEACILNQAGQPDPFLLRLMSLADIKRVKDVLLSFFTIADEAIYEK
jgi:hypothetical protein